MLQKACEWCVTPWKTNVMANQASFAASSSFPGQIEPAGGAIIIDIMASSKAIDIDIMASFKP